MNKDKKSRQQYNIKYDSVIIIVCSKQIKENISLSLEQKKENIYDWEEAKNRQRKR